MIPEKGDGARGLVAIKSCGQLKSSTNKVKPLRPTILQSSQRALGTVTVHTVSVAKKVACLIRGQSLPRAGNRCAAVVKPQSRMWRNAAPKPAQDLMAIRAWRRVLFAFRRAGCQAVHLIEQLVRCLNAVLQTFVLGASYVDLGIAAAKLEPCATSPAHH